MWSFCQEEDKSALVMARNDWATGQVLAYVLAEGKMKF